RNRRRHAGDAPTPQPRDGQDAGHGDARPTGRESGAAAGAPGKRPVGGVRYSMLKYLPYIRKNIFGHRVRTFMTAAGTALLLFLFLFVSSIQQGLDRLLNSRDDRLIVFQAYRFCPSSSQLPIFYEAAVRAVPWVKHVVPVMSAVYSRPGSSDAVVF